MSVQTIQRAEQPAKVKISVQPVAAKVSDLSLHEQLLLRLKAKQEVENKQTADDKDKKIIEKANWFEKSEKKVVDQKCRQKEATMREEVKQAHKAWIKVRRVALQQLFDKEYETYDKEMESQGKTFDKDRM